MNRLARSLLLSSALLLSSCTGYLPRFAATDGALETGFYLDRAQGEWALLEYRLADYFSRSEQPYEVVCAAAERAASVAGRRQPEPLEPAIERLYLQRFERLSPLSRCKVHGRGYVAADHDAPAAVFDVHDFECETANLCFGWAGYHADGPHGWRYYRLEFKDGEWKIRPQELDIIVT